MTGPAGGAGHGDPDARAARPRIAFYSHDATGLGHVRRNLGLAWAVAGLGIGAQTLLVSGTGDAARLVLPPEADLVILPGIHKDRDGRYRPRRLDPGELDRVLELRRTTIAAALAAFDPDLLVVDRYARGFRGELETALDRLAGRGTRILLGIRDVIDDPAAVRADWEGSRTDEALARWYDGILAFTDPAVLQPLAELPGRRPVPVITTGYLVPRESLRDRPATGPTAAGEGRLVVCTVGGGADGREVTAAVAAAPVPSDVRVVILTGPQMPATDRHRLEEIARERPGLTIVEMLSDPRALLDRADAVIAMAGYNTATELLALDAPVLLVPRPFPRAEQRIRARAFAAHGLADVIERDDASPAAIGSWIARAVDGPRVDRSGVDRDGHRAAAAAIGELIGAGRR
ncbi:MAG: hypothetical protein RL338_1086 [Chloroflexota bacterium]